MGKICYRYGDKTIDFEIGGLVAHKDYMTFTEANGQYYMEVGAIEKINRNEENFFDFSKSLVDIGCEVGEYSQFTNFSHFHMFDGNKDKLIMANFNMLISGKSDICDAHNVLLSDKSEDILYDGYNTSYSGFREEDGVFSHETERIQRATTLDSFSLENVGLIKIDVEGMEYKVLLGSISTIIRNNFPPILFECWAVGTPNTTMTQERHDMLENLIRWLGYDIIWNWGDFNLHLAVKR